MFVFALCLFGTALASPVFPPAPILPLGDDVIVARHEVLPYTIPYGIVPEIAPFAPLKFKIEEIPKELEFTELNEEKEEVELEKKEEEEPKTEEQPITEEPMKPVELKPEVVYITPDLPKPHSFIGNWLSYLPFQVPNFVTNWFGRGERLPPSFLYPRVPGCRIVEKRDIGRGVGEYKPRGPRI